MQNTQLDQSFHEDNIQSLSLQLCQNNSKNSQLLKYLQKEYVPGSTKINLGSLYQIPIEAKGVDLLTKYLFWDIEMLNLTYHKIQNQGLQHLIKRALPSFLQTSKQHQHWANLSELALIKNNLTSEGFEGIQSINLQSLRVLRAANNRIDHVAIYKFIECNWPNLVQLEFGNNQIGKEGCRLLMQSKWKHFKRLGLNYNLIENEGVHYLSEADWPELVEINLSNNKIDASATFHLRNAHWPQLNSLILNKNYIGKIKQKSTNIGCQNLCLLKSSSLQKLSLYGNQITLNGIVMLLQSNKLLPGCFLELSRNHFRFQDIKPLLKTHHKFCNQFED